jgi:three-Cys-motif partner protein
MPQSKQTDFDWLRNHLTRLCELAGRVGVSSEYLTYGSHTALKIIALQIYSDTFAKIAHGPKSEGAGYDAAIYIDLFAGPGLVRCTDRGDVIAGSPLAVLDNKYKFNEYIFFERNKKRASSLQNNISALKLGLNTRVIMGDCNVEIDQELSRLKQSYRKPLLLVFVDPEGMEIKFETLRKISRTFRGVDYVINFPAGTNRVAGRIKSGMESDIPIFGDYFGEKAPEILDRYSRGESLDEVYRGQLAEVLGKPLGESVEVKDSKLRAVYLLLFATRITSSGSQYVSAFKSISERLRNLSGVDVVKALDLIKKRQATL